MQDNKTLKSLEWRVVRSYPPATLHRCLMKRRCKLRFWNWWRKKLWNNRNLALVISGARLEFDSKSARPNKNWHSEYNRLRWQEGTKYELQRKHRKCRCLLYMFIALLQLFHDGNERKLIFSFLLCVSKCNKMRECLQYLTCVYLLLVCFKMMVLKVFKVCVKDF